MNQSNENKHSLNSNLIIRNKDLFMAVLKGVNVNIYTCKRKTPMGNALETKKHRCAVKTKRQVSISFEKMMSCCEY